MSSLIAIVTHARDTEPKTLADCEPNEWWTTTCGKIVMKTIHGAVIVYEPHDKLFYVSQSKPNTWLIVKKMADRIELAW